MIATLMNVTGLSKIWLYVAAAGIAVAAVFIVLARTKHAGRVAERADRAFESLEIKHEQLKAAAAAPRGRTAVIDRLRNGPGL